MADDARHLIKGPEFDALFSSFGSTAFRLETRESYYEKDELQAFLEGGPDAVSADFPTGWLKIIRANVEAGRQVSRVRVVSEPHSDYTRFGLCMAERNIGAGEDIRYLPRTHAERLGVPNIDYWILDSERLYILHFLDDDTLLGAEPVTDPIAIERALTWQETTWKNSIPRDVYASG